jgi:hypothetical protein
MQRCAVLMLIGMAISGCGSPQDEISQIEVDARVAPPQPAEQTVRGCVQATGQPGLFLLSVSRHETEGTPPATGEVVPRPGNSPLPPSTAGRSTPPVLPRPGAEPRPEIGAWTLETTVYRLVGDGGLDLAAHLGDTIDVTGALEVKPGNDGGDRPVEGSITVRRAVVVADDCLPQIRR